MTKKADKQIEPYQPNFSEKLEPAAAPAPRGGCLRSIGIYILIPLLLTCVIVMAFGLLGIGQIGNTFKDVSGGNGFCFFNCRDNTVEIDIQQIFLGFKEQAWLESGRETERFDLSASDQVEIGGVVPVPASRALQYTAYVVVTAGIDLQLMDEGDFRIENNQLVITLPAVQIKDCIIDLQTSQVHDRNYYCSTVGVCRDLEVQLQNEALRTAATQGTEDIRTQAFASAQDKIRALAQQFGFTGEVVIEQSAALLPAVANNGTCYQSPDDPALATPFPTGTP